MVSIGFCSRIDDAPPDIYKEEFVNPDLTLREAAKSIGIPENIKLEEYFHHINNKELTMEDWDKTVGELAFKTRNGILRVAVHW